MSQLRAQKQNIIGKGGTANRPIKKEVGMKKVNITTFVCEECHHVYRITDEPLAQKGINLCKECNIKSEKVKLSQPPVKREEV